MYKYSIQPFYYGEDHNELLNFTKNSPFFDFYKMYLSKKRFYSKSNVAGLIILVDKKIVGSTLLIIHDEKNISIGNISCTYIDESHRGNSYSSILINEAKKYCDVLTDITPVDSIIHLIKKGSISCFSSISDYQSWINPRLIRVKKYSCTIRDNNLNDLFFIENINYGMSFTTIEDENEQLIIGYYKFKRMGLKVLEISFINKKNFFSTHKDEIIKLLYKKEKFDIVFVDSVFFESNKVIKILKNKKTKLTYLKNVVLLFFSKEIAIENRKFYWKKEGINWNPHFLSSELCFYE